MTRHNKLRWNLLAALILMMGVPLSVAQKPNRPNPNRPQNRPAEEHHAGDWLRKYKDVPPQQQQKALNSDPQFRRLPPERQDRLRDRLQRFSTLPPQQQTRILHRMETWEHLTPDQKQEARGLFREMRSLPPDRRQRVESAIRELRGMPPAQRQQMLESPQFRTRFSPEEQQVLEGITKLPLAPPSPPGEGEEQR